MQIKELEIAGILEINLSPDEDSRGFFMRTYDNQILGQYRVPEIWPQESESYSKFKWTVRGFHFQHPPFTEAKLIRIIQGKAFFVILDLREKSKTFGQWTQAELSEDKKNMLYVPRGCTPCMCTLTDSCRLSYKMDNIYSPAHYDNLKWDDQDLKIPWPVTIPEVISEKDAGAQSFREFVEKFGSLKVNEKSRNRG